MILLDDVQPRLADENGKALPDWLSFERYADNDYDPATGQGNTYDWWRLTLPDGSEAVIAEYSTPFSYPGHRYDVFLDDNRTNDQVAFSSLDGAIGYAEALHSGRVTRDMLALEGTSALGEHWYWADLWQAADRVEPFAVKIAEEYLDGEHQTLSPIEVVQDDFEHGRIVLFNGTYVPTGLEDSHIGAADAMMSAAEYIWDVFQDYPAVDEDGRITEEFLNFPAGTDREEIWHAIEDELQVPVHTLMFKENTQGDEPGEKNTAGSPVVERSVDHMRFRLASDLFNGEHSSAGEHAIDAGKEH